MKAKEEKAYQWVRVEARVKIRLADFCRDTRPAGVKRYGLGKGLAALLDFYEEHQGGRDAL